MITKLIIDFLLLLPNTLLDLVPHLEIAIPEGIFNSLNSILGLLGFVFPVKGLLVIITTSISIKLFHIVSERVGVVNKGEGNSFAGIV